MQAAAATVVRVDPVSMRQRAARAPVARLATVSADGHPHLVPICFALVEALIVTAIDAKPKRTVQLKRVSNISATGLASVLIDEYAEDWSRLWWVRVDGPARVLGQGELRQAALAALLAKYPQYRAEPPNGAVLAVEAARWTCWEARNPG